MKKSISLFITLIVLIISILFFCISKKNFSYNENRYLECYPSFSLEKIFNGEYMNSLSNYVSDHFPFRNLFLQLKTFSFKNIGVRYQNGLYYGDDGYLLEEYKKPVKTDAIINKINEFSHDVDVVSDVIIAPTSIYVNSDKLSLYNKNFDEGITIDNFKNKIKGNFIDVSKILKDNNNKYLYYKTDHHWTSLGAYYAYLEYCRNKEITANDYEFEIVSKNFYGTLYSKVLDNQLNYDIIKRIVDYTKYEVSYNDKNVKTNSLYNSDYLEKKDKYSYFLDNNHSLIEINNLNSDSNESLLIIKDSYANSFIPLIAKHYKYIYVIDPRYYKKSIKEFVYDYSPDNILFLYNVLTIDSDIGILSIY